MDRDEEEKDQDQELKPDAQVRVRILLTICADVDLSVYNHKGGKGAYVKTEIPEKALHVTYYGAYPDSDASDKETRYFLTTQAAHTVADIAAQKLGKKLGHEPSPDDTPPSAGEMN